MKNAYLKDEVLKPIRWHNNILELIDQTQLPSVQQYNKYTSVESVAQAIETMVVRGAPAIGITAAYGLIFALDDCLNQACQDIDLTKDQQHILNVDTSLRKAYQTLHATRPTAINLKFALDRMLGVWEEFQHQSNTSLSLKALRQKFLDEALLIHSEDLAFNYEMAQHALKAIHHDNNAAISVLTHCNTGSLACGGLGTALGIIKVGYRSQIIDRIYITETRPWLQGSRLTAFELSAEDIPYQLMVEGATGSIMKQGLIDWLIVGADRITANGDVANKIGTYSLAVLAKAHNIKVMVAAPSTTLDFQLASGDDIPIELRSPAEVLKPAGYDLEDPQTQAINVFNPAFDITPASFIDLIVTEKGACKPEDLYSFKPL